MNPLGIFLVGVAALAALPLLIASIRGQFQAVLLYTHIAAMIVLGGLMGPVYVLPLGGDVMILAGQVYYGSFMFTTLLATVVGRDLAVVRKIIVVVIVVDLVAVAALTMAHAALTRADVVNPLGIPAALFDASRVQQLSGAILSVVELLLLLAALELAKKRLSSRAMMPMYPLTFVAILVFDGVLFPLLVLRPSDGLGDIIASGVQGKVVLAIAYAVPLALFVLLSRRTVERFEAQQLGLRYLVDLTRDPLLDELDEQRSRLISSAETADRASAMAARLLDAATNTVLIATDSEFTITHFNRGAERIFGRVAGDTIGLDVATLFDAEEFTRQAGALGVPSDPRSVLHAHLSASEPRDWRFNVDGAAHVASLSITEIRITDRVVGYLIAGEDVTGRLRAEQAVRVALDNEQQSRVRLQDADRVKQELISTVSHELRTPIASIRGYLELLADGDYGGLTPQQAEAVTRVLRNSDRLTRLVGDLLTLERTEAGASVSGDRRALDLRDVVLDCTDLVREQAHPHDLELDLPTSTVTVVGDRAALQQMLLNLVDNAIKFTPVEGKVVVRLRDLGSGARVEVADTGIGIRPEDQPHLFTRFFRSGDAVAMEAQGTGLGLAIVKAIVVDHQGQIQVDSSPGRGTTVTVDLPSSPA